MADRGTETPSARLRGVNLGGWLLLEKWMTPSLFQGLAAADETTWCAELGPGARKRLRDHWERFITRTDFDWLAGIGINAVRIPLGHWIFGPPYPYHPMYGDNPHPFVEGGIDVLDRALDWAAASGLKVILDLHAAPGCQNGLDNGGIRDVCEWHTREEYIAGIYVLRIRDSSRKESTFYIALERELESHEEELLSDGRFSKALSTVVDLVTGIGD